MKKTQYILSLLLLAIGLSCSSEDALNIDIDTIGAPTNISALTTVTQDNTGKVTFLPKGEGVTSFEIYFGDGTIEPAYVNPGSTTTHSYAEGTYQVKIVGTTLNGKRTEVMQTVLVSFAAPQNLVVTITNDLSVSKKVNVTATADFALFYDVYFGEAGKPDPISANNGETVSYTYQEVGVYSIRVVSKSAAAQTTEVTQDFAALIVSSPSVAAPMQPNRLATDVVSIYSSKYSDFSGTNFYPNWGQTGTFAEFDLNGDKMLNYIKLTYQGIALADGKTIDVSTMDFLHMDVWTADLPKLETSLISLTNGEKPVVKDLNLGQWTSLDIPISAFTSQGLTVADIFQLKLVGLPGGGSIYMDNIYFYKAPAESLILPINFESTNLTYGWGGFGGVATAVIPNPDKTGANTSTNVLKLDKSSTAETWGGASLHLDAKIDWTKGTKIKIAVWSPKVGATILFKMEDSNSPKDGNNNPTIFVEVQAISTVANAWEILTFDVTSAASFSSSNKYDSIILFPDFGKNGTAGTYYFDDIKQAN